MIRTAPPALVLNLAKLIKRYWQANIDGEIRDTALEVDAYIDTHEIPDCLVDWADDLAREKKIGEQDK